MDFFTQQDKARKQTGKLVLLFVVAMLSLIVLTNVLLIATFWGLDQYFDADSSITIAGILQYSDPQQWGRVSLCVVLVVSAASIYRWSSLRGGGQAVAEMLGGRLIPLNTSDLYQQRVLNVVEEMALAAGMPIPPVYLMPDPTINAFAAGYKASNAVIGVTQGCIENLSRPQLQGVIAHEFSHILNGDMRLNIRLMSLLFGLLFIALIGRFILRAAMYGGSSNNDNKNSRLPLWAAGLGLMVIGYSGVFFGNIIKAAVSRQREFLADASAVQFTRDPSTISDALKVIGHGIGSEIEHPEREEAAHMFFGEAVPFSGMFATHPPLEERIRRIEPNWNGKFLPPAKKLTGSSFAQRSTAQKPPIDYVVNQQVSGAAAMAATAGVVNSKTTPTKEVSASEFLRNQAYAPYSARSLMFALLMADGTDPAVRREQQKIILDQQGEVIAKDVEKLLTYKDKLASGDRLRLVEQAIPSLKSLSTEQWQATNVTLMALIKADGEIDLFEWCLFRLITLYVTDTFKPKRLRFIPNGKPKQVAREIGTVLSYMAHYGHDDHQEAYTAFVAGSKAAGFDELGIELLDIEEVSNFQALNKALSRLVNVYPHVKALLLKSLTTCAKVDGEIRPIERDLITTLAAILECPTPTLE